MKKKKVFMVSYGGGHVNILSRVYIELCKDNDIEVIFLALTSASLQLRNMCIRHITMKDLVSFLPYKDDVEQLGIKYGMPNHNDQSGICMEDTISYYGVGLYDLIQKYGEREAINKFKNEGRKAFLPVESMKLFLEKIHPDICVVTTSPRVEMATALAGNSLGIPVVRINDLPICDKIPYSCSLCVMSEWAKKYAIQHAGVLEKDIYVTGQPIFDENKKVDEDWEDNFKKSTSEYNNIVVFFTQNGKKQFDELDALYEIAEIYQDILFIIKIHPNQNINLFSKFAKKNVWIRKESATYYLKVANLVITTFSTTGLEAAMMGIPVIEIKFDDVVYPLEYCDMGIARLAKNKEQLLNEIVELLESKGLSLEELVYRQALFKYIPNASLNVCNVIKSNILESR